MMKGSRVTAKIAGIESTAKTMSSSSTDDEAAILVLIDRRDCAAKEPVKKVPLGLRRPIGVGQELDAGEHQECAKQVTQPLKPLKQDGAHCNEDSPHYQRSEDSPEQNPVLQLRGHREPRQRHEEYEDVVDRQSLFDQIPGEELEPALLADPKVHPKFER